MLKLIEVERVNQKTDTEVVYLINALKQMNLHPNYIRDIEDFVQDVLGKDYKKITSPNFENKDKLKVII